MGRSARVARELLRVTREHNGVITAAMVSSLGLSRGHLQRLERTGKLERAKLWGLRGGVYYLPEVWEDEYYSAQYRFARGVYSHETALYLWELTDEAPAAVSMSFPAHYNVSRAKAAGIRCKQCKPEWYCTGITRLKSPAGNHVAVYDRERTLCDLMRTHADAALIVPALRRYLHTPHTDLPKLTAYARACHLDPRLKHYLEAMR